MDEDYIKMNYVNLELWKLGFSKEERDKIIDVATQTIFGPVELGRALYKLLHSDTHINNTSFLQKGVR
jgi:hypothetical protein